jgi:hypothetical protein
LECGCPLAQEIYQISERFTLSEAILNRIGQRDYSLKEKAD